jgi:hypothetical protein
MKRQADLFEIVRALRSPGRFTGGLNGRKQQRDQHSDNRNHHEKLDQGEAAAHFHLPGIPARISFEITRSGAIRKAHAFRVEFRM